MEQKIHTDIFIAGAGASGIAAAVAAAQSGMKVCIVEKNSYPGGRATASAVGTICGLYLRSHGEQPTYAMQGFPKQFGERLINNTNKQPQKFSEGLWFIPCMPQDFKQTALYFLNHENITVLYNTTVLNVDATTTHISNVTCEKQGEQINIIANAFIDCSGDAILCTAINHTIIKDTTHQAAAIVFAIENVTLKDEFSLSFSIMKSIFKNIEEQNIPEHFNLLSIVPASLNQNSVLFKMGLPWEVGLNNVSDVDLENKARTLIKEVTLFLKEEIRGFENSTLGWIADEVGIRTGLRAKGKKILTDDDILNCVKHEDGICKGAWPVEYWRIGNKKVEMTWFAENDFYTIPAGCLLSPEKENLFFGGKIISAEEKAIASARVIGTCLGTGFAAGFLASYKMQNRSEQNAIDFINLEMLGK